VTGHEGWSRADHDRRLDALPVPPVPADRLTKSEGFEDMVFGWVVLVLGLGGIWLLFNL
jgi:hypothetical protein